MEDGEGERGCGGGFFFDEGEGGGGRLWRGARDFLKGLGDAYIEVCCYFWGWGFIGGGRQERGVFFVGKLRQCCCEEVSEGFCRL